MEARGIIHLVFCMACCFPWVFSFNLDISEPLIFRSKGVGDYFGFTVALHSYHADKWLLVGAPLANHTAPFGSRKSQHERYGGVFKCRPRKGSACEVVPIDTTDPLYQDFNGVPVDIEEKSGQWLGGSLYSTGKNGKVVTCAPRYALRGNFVNLPQKRPRNVIGRCFLVRSDLRGVTRRVEPCFHGFNGRELMYGYGQHGLCQAGFSSVISKDGSTIGFGAPGVGYGKGTIGAFFLDSLTKIFASRSDMKIDYFGDVMGYTVAAGRFKRSGREQLIGSSPRADDVRGRVMAFDVIGEEQIKVSFTLPVPPDIQPGSSFGLSVCAVDLNNDGLSDLLVGAPRYTYDRDEGRVYVYINNGLGALNLMESMVLDGDKTLDANFGFSIASAGDMNKDNFNDVAVGAPYGGPDGRGAVYIYYGTKDGIHTKYRQRILASEMGDPALKTFGYSLSGALDVDNNQYPDLGVGAYSSDRAVLLRTRPIVQVMGKIQLSTEQIILESNKTNMCNLQGQQHKCLTATVCLKYKYKVPSSSQGLDVDYSLELDQDRQADDLRRLFFAPNNATKKVFSAKRSFRLAREDTWQCDTHLKIFLRKRDQIGDLMPLTVDLKYELKKTAACDVCPILDDYDNVMRRTVRAEVLFQKHCKDKICVPDLTVKGHALFTGGYKDLRIGISQQMFVSITVENKAEDFAYPGKVVVTYPAFLGYVGSGVNQGVQCKRMLISEEVEKAECVVGMPFKGHAKKTFDLTFATAGVKGNISKFHVDLEATSPSVDANPNDNKVRLEVAVKFEADLSITGSSVPDQVVYSNKGKASSTLKVEEDIGPEVTQTVVVRNNGPSAVDGSQVRIDVPWKKDSKDEYSYLLYLLNVRVRGSAAACEVQTNPLNLKMSNSSASNPAVLESSSRDDSKKRTRRAGSKLTEMTCGNVQCLQFTCRLGRLEQGDGVEIHMTSRLWQNTLAKAGVESVDLVTKATIIPPSSITQPPNDDNNEVLVIIRANPKEGLATSEPTPTWIIVVSVLAGLLLLALSIFGLYKAGFFKRKRPEEDEDQLGGENGHQQYEKAPQDV